MSSDLVLTGTKGTAFNLVTGREGVLAARGVSGLLFPSFEQRIQETASGVRWWGARTTPRRVSLTLQVGDNIASAVVPPAPPAPDPFRPDLGRRRGAPLWRVGEEFRELDRQLRENLNPHDMVTFRCTTEGSERTLNAVVSEVSDSIEVWSDVRGWQEYDVEFTALNPYWQGTPVSVSLPITRDAAQDYYNVMGPPFFVGGAATEQGHITTHNGGEVAAWPTWTFTGPGSFIVEDTKTGGHISTRKLNAGEVLVVNTGERTVTDRRGANAWAKIARRSFTPINPGAQAQFKISAQETGDGSAALMTYTPQHLGAY